MTTMDHAVGSLTTALGAWVAPDTVMGHLGGPGPSKGQERAWFAKP